MNLLDGVIFLSLFRHLFVAWSFHDEGLKKLSLSLQKPAYENGIGFKESEREGGPGYWLKIQKQTLMRVQKVGTFLLFCQLTESPTEDLRCLLSIIHLSFCILCFGHSISSYLDSSGI